MKSYSLRLQHGEMVDDVGLQKAVIVRRFETLDGEADNEGWDEFEREKEFRRDVL